MTEDVFDALYPTLYDESLPSPDEAVKGIEAERELGVPAAAAVGNERVDLLLRQRRDKKHLKDRKFLQQFLADPTNAALAKDDLPALSDLERQFKAMNEITGYLGNAARVGAINLRAGVQFRLAERRRDIASFIGLTRPQIEERILPKLVLRDLEATGQWLAIAKRREEISEIEAAIAGLDPVREDRVVAEKLTGVGELLARSRKIPRLPAAERFKNEDLAAAFEAEDFWGGVMGAFDAFAANPEDGIAFMADLFAESSIPMVAGAATTLVTRNPAAGVGAMATGSLTAEYSGAVQEFIASEGIDLTTPEGVKAALQNPGVLREAERRGVIKGLVVAALDAVSGGVAGQVLSNSPVGDIVLQGMAQAFLGGTGEGVGAKLATGKVNGAEVFFEALLEVAGTPVEITLVAGRRLGKKESARAARSEETAKLMDQLDKALAASKLRERSPDKFREYLHSLDDGVLYVPADDLETLFQNPDLGPEDFGIDPTRYEDMLSSGGDVVISAAAYDEHIFETESAQWFKDHATISDHVMSRSEAQISNDEVQAVNAAEFEKSEQEAEEARQSQVADVQIHDALQSQFRTAGMGRREAAASAAKWQAFFRTQGERYGEDPLDLAQQLGVKVIGPKGEQRRVRGGLDIAINNLRAQRGKKQAKPEGLLDFIAGLGGLQDRGGDIAALQGPVGLVSETAGDMAQISALPTSRRGVGPDDAVRQAVEAGFFPELAGLVESSDVAEMDMVPMLIEAIAREIAGDPTVRVQDADPDPLAPLAAEIERLGLSLEMSNDEIIAALDVETLNQPGLDLARDGAWRDVDVVGKNVAGEDVQINAGYAVDILNERTDAARRLLECVNAG